ncbi:MarR family winged helix-turn-helix transcriptional regulator [Kineosporia succinea]|uniref:DNA-binding MarR family transcriptional regulator n=1 Tax=Kineosporia succinea TaxID=84632 RepID=A0ABT9PD20_9ACTN|nr:MarR family transcriptional regulator [Kineosporia succinea]MDP9830606.1 DNA-binding MarR family transcriptional regulator [Kineosporia succinea]
MTSEKSERARLLGVLDAAREAMETSTLPAAVRRLLDSDLTFQQVKVLTVLVTRPDGLTVRGLAEHFGVSMASMSTMIDRLVAQDIARRDVDPADSRVRRIHATPHGRDVLRRLVSARPEFEESTLEGLALDDLRALAQGMQAVARAFRPSSSG